MRIRRFALCWKENPSFNRVEQILDRLLREHEPGDADAQGLNELVSEINDLTLAITRRGECKLCGLSHERLSGG